MYHKVNFKGKHYKKGPLAYSYENCLGPLRFTGVNTMD